jgi:hypothetical protein
VAGAVAALNKERRIEFGRQVRKALEQYTEGDGVAIPDEVNIAMGRA